MAPTAITKEELTRMIKEEILPPLLKRHKEETEAVENELKKRDPDPEAFLSGNPDLIKALGLVKEDTPPRARLAGGIVRAMAAGKALDCPGGSYLERAKYAAEHIHKDMEVRKALELQDVVAGGALVSEERLPGVIELLRSAAKFRLMQPTIIPMVNGSASISRMTGGATANYLGESQNIDPSEPTTGLIQMTEKKLAAIVPISNDLLRIPSVQVDTVVEDDLRSALGLKSDWAFMRGAGTQYVPKGIEKMVLTANTFAANATVNLANVTTDIANLVLKLINNNVRMLRPGFLMAPRTAMYLKTVRDANGNFAFREEMLAGRLFGFPYEETTQVPINLGGGSDESIIYFCDWADIVIAEAMAIEIIASNEAAYWDGSNIAAAFSLDQTVIRAIEKHDLATRHDESIATMTAVKWTP